MVDFIFWHFNLPEVKILQILYRNVTKPTIYLSVTLENMSNKTTNRNTVINLLYKHLIQLKRE